jgi:hypothetical protein
MLIRSSKWRGISPMSRFIIRGFASEPPAQPIRRIEPSTPYSFPRSYTMKKASRKNYTPLDSAQDSIRLRLKPAENPSSPIHCSLFHTSLSKAPPYVALSYCWGDRASLQQVFIENETVTVTPNLKHALQRLRPTSGKDLVLWVDTICIYQNAESVAIWLGLESQKSSEAIQFARDLAACDTEEASALVQDPASKEHLKTVVVLFRRQYWWRIWVIQEVFCARNSMVYCGTMPLRGRSSTASAIFSRRKKDISETYFIAGLRLSGHLLVRVREACNYRDIRLIWIARHYWNCYSRTRYTYCSTYHFHIWETGRDLCEAA